MAETDGVRSKLRELLTGCALGLLAGLVVKELDLTGLVSFYVDGALLATVGLVLGGVLFVTPLRPVVPLATVALVAFWLLVAWTPLTYWMSQDLPRREPLEPADAVYVLGSGLQDDGELSTLAMSRLLHGLEVLGEGWAPRLILPELPAPHRSYREAACDVMMSLGLGQEVLTVGPVRDTHDEAVQVAALANELDLGRIILVTSPSHSRRASAAFEAAGVRVLSSPSQQTLFDYENLESARGDQSLQAFGFLAHEYVGLYYYRLRGWIGR